MSPDRGHPSDCRDRCRGLVVGDKDDCPNLRTASSRDRISLDVINIESATAGVLTSRGANDNLGLRVVHWTKMPEPEECV